MGLVVCVAEHEMGLVVSVAEHETGLVVSVAEHCICFNCQEVTLSQILAFGDFCVVIFTDSHVLPSHKSLI